MFVRLFGLSDSPPHHKIKTNTLPAAMAWVHYGSLGKTTRLEGVYSARWGFSGYVRVYYYIIAAAEACGT